MNISIEDVVHFARGAAFLGTGGGGDPYLGRLLLEQTLKEFPAPEVISVEDVPDDALVIPAGMMGAPTVLIEKLPNGQEAQLALKRMEEAIGQSAYAITPAEIGGLNALLPVVLAARSGLPVIDGDGMGRAFPELQMVTFNVHGVKLAPVTMADEHGNVVLVDSATALHGEHLARHLVVAMGCSCHICLYPMSGKQAKESTVRGTLSLALGIGRSIHEARAGRRDPFAALLDYLGGTEYYHHRKILFDGKIVDLLRETDGGFVKGRVTMDAVGDSIGRMEIDFQNENLIARVDGKTVAIVPDLVCILDRETAEPITTENLRYGQRVKVIGASVPPIMRSDRALQIFGPEQFGYDEAFTPIESL